ncbi:MAG: hypothetical protein ACYDG4_00385 [Desulfuromonadaceae bacterium]
MGRKPLDTKLKLLSGSFRKDRVIKGAPEYDLVSDFPASPNHLNADGAEMWNRLGRQLVACKVLQVVDLYILEQLCFSWQRFRQKAKAGADITAAENNAMKSLFAEFGMTPASRGKVAASSENKPANRFANNGIKQMM